MGFKQDLVTDLRSSFLNVGEFAQSGLYNSASSGEYAVVGVFDSAYESVNPDSGAPVISTQPKLTIIEADLQTIPGPGDTITVNNAKYKVVDYQPDGKGLVTLLLSRTI